MKARRGPSRATVECPGLGADWTPVDGVTVSADARVGIPERGGGEDAVDALIQLHLWF